MFELRDKYGDLITRIDEFEIVIGKVAYDLKHEPKDESYIESVDKEINMKTEELNKAIKEAFDKYDSLTGTKKVTTPTTVLTRDIRVAVKYGAVPSTCTDPTIRRRSMSYRSVNLETGTKLKLKGLYIGKKSQEILVFDLINDDDAEKEDHRKFIKDVEIPLDTFLSFYVSKLATEIVSVTTYVKMVLANGIDDSTKFYEECTQSADVLEAIDAFKRFQMKLERDLKKEIEEKEKAKELELIKQKISDEEWGLF